MVTTEPLKSPFPYPGGKSKVADMVWDRLGNVDNFIEPFMGSLAVTLRRPAAHFANGYRVETCNDLNHFIVNFWRAVQQAPEEVAKWSDSPVLEADLHARHKWLMRSDQAVAWRKRMVEDAEYFDAKIAGWWCWGACCWIGGAWCAHKIDQNNMPLLDPSQKGINRRAVIQIPELSSGVGRGDTAAHAGGRPQLTDAFDIGRGVNANGNLEMKRLDIRICSARREWLIDWMQRLSDRLRLVRTCYGHWSRICDSDSTMTRLGLTGVFLDPPYPSHRSDNGKKSRDASLYATDKGADLNALRDEVLAWCRKWGRDKQVRIAVCGYEGDGYEPLEAEGWSVESWETSGGYGNQRKKGKGKSENAKRERIWFSPACLKSEAQPTLFDFLE